MKIQIGLIPWKSNACVEVSCTFDPDGAKNRAMFRAEKIGLVGTNPIDFILIIFVVRAHWAPFRCDRAFQKTAFWALLKKTRIAFIRLNIAIIAQIQSI